MEYVEGDPGDANAAGVLDQTVIASVLKKVQRGGNIRRFKEAFAGSLGEFLKPMVMFLNSCQGGDDGESVVKNDMILW
jgi:hypothetical protein